MRPWSDAFGRTIRALRVSVTDRCNVRCLYCMPAEPRWLDRKDLLSYEELARLVRVAVRHGVRKVRITGGEPLLRQDLPAFVRMLKPLPGLEDLALTTNAVALAEQAGPLREAGLDRITVSLDTLDTARYERITRRRALPEVLQGLSAAEQAGFRPLKVNAVVVRGFNEDEVVSLAEWARASGRMMRFIEFMPLEGDPLWSRERVVPAAEILERLAGRFPFVPAPAQSGCTSQAFDYADGRGGFAVVAAVSRAFCGSCDRLRITADGGLRTCLFGDKAADLRALLRNGADDRALAEAMGEAVSRKASGHRIHFPGFKRPDCAMHSIGG
ncbi:MAG TPA: GTP 3',8-cyclase MoaA [Elusimicrobia bacterium]|nr:GTP 3',8-cyclase MoaA [Elusimicrobiota bacterium]